MSGTHPGVNNKAQEDRGTKSCPTLLDALLPVGPILTLRPICEQSHPRAHSPHGGELYGPGGQQHQLWILSLAADVHSPRGHS
jgi:hypothetical protein